MKEFVVPQIVKTERELNALRDFLRMNQLPADDLKIADSVYLTYYNSEDVLVGSGGLEFYGDKALLRSLAVSQAMRSQSLGKQIVDELIQQLKETGKKEIYLLTTTAYFFFLKFGFVEIPSDAVPEEVKASTEFSQVCPSTARVMRLNL
jgi:N-acetylglutamate synthase-like GNAT family acetyltransferase